MKYFRILILIFLSKLVSGQELPLLTADQILDSSLKFCGGWERISKIESSEINYLLIQPDSATAIVSEKKIMGEKYVQSILSKNHYPQTTFFNGKKVSIVDSSFVIHIEKIKSIEEVRLKTFDQIQYGYKKLKYKLVRQEDKKFKSFDCYVIEATGENGYSTINFFDKSNFKLLMVSYPNGNKSLMMEHIFKDSVLYNSHITNTFSDSEDLQDLRLRSVELNTKISDLWFNCPYEDKVFIPDFIKKGKFESANGEKTNFTRSDISQDYSDDSGKIVLRRYLVWTGSDYYSLIDEKVLKDNSESNESEILVRIISWDKLGYVCHWITAKYTGVQDYKIKN